jgi:hypothetical protein
VTESGPGKKGAAAGRGSAAIAGEPGGVGSVLGSLAGGRSVAGVDGLLGGLAGFAGSPIAISLIISP